MELFRYVLKNPTTGQTLILQEMIHVAKKSFFMKINEDMKSFLRDNPNGRILVEQVKPDPLNDLEQQDRIKNQFFKYLELTLMLKNINEKNNFMILFSKLLGGEYSYQYPDLYLKGIQEQDNDSNGYSVFDITADNLISIIDIKADKESLNINELHSSLKSKMVDFRTIEKWVNNKVIGFLIKPFAKMITKKILNKSFNNGDLLKKVNPNLNKTMTDLLKYQKIFFDTIINDRNDYVINELIKKENDNQIFFITYGAFHLRYNQDQENEQDSIIKQLIENHGYNLVSVKKIENVL